MEAETPIPAALEYLNIFPKKRENLLEFCKIMRYYKNRAQHIVVRQHLICCFSCVKFINERNYVTKGEKDEREKTRNLERD